MGKDKLKRFSQLKTFKNVIQPQANYYSSDDPIKGNWCDIFENKNPIIIELGCGAGEYTIGLSRLFPKNNFIGVDIKGARLWKGAKIAEDEKLINVRFLRTKIDFISKFFAENEIDEIWLTFSDPQPKKPRKRLTSKLFINRFSVILKNNGLIHLKTDSDLLYQFTKDEIINHNYCHQSDEVADVSLRPMSEGGHLHVVGFSQQVSHSCQTAQSLKASASPVTIAG